MNVEARVTIHGSRSATWAVISDIEHAAETIRGIERIEILERPANGLVGLRWRETRVLFGKPATAEKWITEAAEGEFYATRADEQGFVYRSILRISESDGALQLVSTHLSEPHGFAARLLAIPMGLLFRGVARKALLQDLNDLKAAVERR
jgi:hypothetical protein